MVQAVGSSSGRPKAQAPAEQVPSAEESKQLQSSSGSYEEASSHVKNTELNQNVSSGGSDSYDDEDSQGSDSSSESSEEDLEESMVALHPATDYYFSMETQHKDFVRSMVQFGDNILITASEDKTMKVFYF